MYKKIIAGVAAVLMAATSVPLGEVADVLPKFDVTASAAEGSKAIEEVTKEVGTLDENDANNIPVNLGGKLNGYSLIGKITVHVDKYGKTKVTLEPLPSLLSSSESTYTIDMSDAMKVVKEQIPEEAPINYDNCEVVLSGRFNYDKNTNLSHVVFNDNVITTVGSSMFEGSKYLQTVDFSNSKITKLESGVFKNCEKFVGNSKSNTIDLKNIVSIGENAFEGCTNLNYIKFDENTTTIKNSAFANCTGLRHHTKVENDSDYKEDTTLEIPSKVESIGNGVFSNCTKLQSVVFGYNCAPEFGDSVFSNCSALEHVTVYDKDNNKAAYNTLPENSFIKCKKPRQKWDSDQKQMVDETDEYGDPVYDTTNTVGTGVFSNCTKLQSFTVPDTFTRLGDSMFENCTNLGSITFNKEKSNCTHIGSSTFFNCSKLDNVYLPDKTVSLGCYDDNYNCSPNGSTFGNCIAMKKIIVSDNFSGLGAGTFGGCWNLSFASYSYESQLNPLQIIIPDNVLNIPSKCFNRCTYVKKADTKNVVAIGDEAFMECKDIASVTLGDSLAEIGERGFRQCESLPEINIPDGVTVLNKEVFSLCTSLKDVKYSSSLSTISDSVFDSCESLDTFTPNNQKKYEHTLKFAPTVGGVHNSAFAGCKTFKYINFITDDALKSTIYPDGTKFSIIGDSAFERCTNFVGSYINSTASGNIGMPYGVKVIGKSAFKSCTSLDKIVFTGSVETIDEAAFQSCTSLKSVTVKSSAEGDSEPAISDVKKYAFAECTALEDLPKAEVNNKVINALKGNINEGAFYHCYSLNAITIPSSIGAINSKAFANCYDEQTDKGLTSVTFEDGSKITSIDDEAFAGCKKLGKLSAKDGYSLPVTVGQIGASAFSNTAIENLKLKYTSTNNTLTLNERSFSNCDNLTSVDLSNTNLTQTGNYTFSNCKNLKKVELPNTTITISEGTFDGCVNLSSLNSNEKGKYNIPSNVSDIKDLAFNQNLNMSEINIPAATSKIVLSCFNFNFEYKKDEYNPLKAINVAENNMNYTSVDGVLFTKDKKELLLYPFMKEGDTVDFNKDPYKDVTILTPSCFGSNNFVEHVILSNKIQEIGRSVFNRCENLKSIDFGDNKTVKIDDGAIENCNPVIYAAKDSTAYEKYANSGIPFVDNNTAAVKMSIKQGSSIVVSVRNTKEKQLNVVLTDGNGQETKEPNLRWTSSDESVATVNDDGLVTLTQNKGETVIKVSTSNGRLSASIKLIAENSVNLDNCEIILPADSFEYTGSEIKPEVKVKIKDSDEFVDADSYTVEYKNNTNSTTDSSKATVTVKSKAGLSTGSTSKDFNIVKRNLENCDVSLSKSEFDYTGSAIIIDQYITVSKDGKTLVKDKDYKLSYKNNVNAGTASVTIIPCNSYTEGSKTVEFRILPYDIGACDVSLSETNFMYTGNPITVDSLVKVVRNGQQLVQGVHYTLSYSNNKDEGTATVTVSGIEGVSVNSKELNFTIIKKPAKTAFKSVKRQNLKYSKAEWKAIEGIDGYQMQIATTKSFKGAVTVKVKDPSRTFKTSVGKTYYVRVRAYKVVNGLTVYAPWSNAKSIAKVTKPAKTTASAKSYSKKSVKVKWKKVKSAAGYQIQISKSSKFKGSKLVTASKKYSAKTITKLSSKKKYYVRVRAYKSVGGKRYYGAWSKVKAARIK